MNNVQHPLPVESKLWRHLFTFKLGLMKNIVKTICKVKTAFKYVQYEFPRMHEAKEGIFVRPEILKLLLDENFDKVLREKTAWKGFRSVASNFLGKERTEK